MRHLTERGTWVSNSGVDSITLVKQLLYQARAHKSTSTDHTCLLSNFLDTGHDFTPQRMKLTLGQFFNVTKEKRFLNNNDVSATKSKTPFHLSEGEHVMVFGGFFSPTTNVNKKS